MMLNWPPELVIGEEDVEPWCQPASNHVLDFHGDPIKARLVVFSDGNHHMALLECLKAFYNKHPEVKDIFYATTPPYPIVRLLESGVLRLGNLMLSVKPHVFISPPEVMEKLKAGGYVKQHRLLAENRGSVLLVSKGNPKGIHTLSDLMRRDVRLFISNPDTEKTSYSGYRKTLEGMAQREGLDKGAFIRNTFGETVMYGQRIHHREAPGAVATGRVDAAIVYFHLALRYMRIFPDLFDILPLGGTQANPEPPPENLTAEFHVGLVHDGGDWGECFMKFMLGEAAADIYTHHGLVHRQNLRFDDPNG